MLIILLLLIGRWPILNMIEKWGFSFLGMDIKKIVNCYNFCPSYIPYFSMYVTINIRALHLLKRVFHL